MLSPTADQSGPARSRLGTPLRTAIVIGMRKLGRRCGALALDHPKFVNCEHHSPPAALAAVGERAGLGAALRAHAAEAAAALFLLW
jgi:hypothetical protein